MPDLNGYDVPPLIAKLRPDIRVIVSSGYSDLEVKRHFPAMRIATLLPKPYTSEQFLAHVLPALGCYSSLEVSGGTVPHSATSS